MRFSCLRKLSAGSNVNFDRCWVSHGLVYLETIKKF
jgi:hypothetical protein